MARTQRIRCANCNWHKMTKKQKAEILALIEKIENDQKSRVRPEAQRNKAG